MAKARNILKRVRAIGNIRRVTKTMEMVATARFKRIHDRAVNLRPYTNRLAELTGDLANRGSLQRMAHPLLVEYEHLQRDVVLILTSDRGLCGPYNAQILRLSLERLGQLIAAEYETLVRVVGKRGIQQLHYRGLAVDRTYERLAELPAYEKVTKLADELMREYLSAEISGLEVVYMQFIWSGRQRPAVAQILPLSNLPRPQRRPALGEPPEYELLPSPEHILDTLLPMTVRLRLYQCFLDAAVSEQFERIVAMRSATENADEMIHDLSVRYNRLRQGQITTELSEIVGGQAGVRRN